METTQSDAMTGAVLRLEEAINQRKTFWSAWADHLSTAPWDFTLEKDSALEYRLMGREVRAVPPTLGLHFSIWLQQLRSALDNALYACVGLRQRKFPPDLENQLEFPITRSPKAFKSAKAIRTDAVDPDVKVCLERCQPYQSEYDDWTDWDVELSPLFWLNELARIDRHRLMHVGVGSILIPRNLLLHGGAEHEVTQVAEAGHLLVGTTQLLAYRTKEPLQSLDFKFRMERAEILPEIAGWSSAKARLRISSVNADYYEGYFPLRDRMETLEDTVIRICMSLATMARVEREQFSGLRRRTYQPTPEEKAAWEKQRAEQRRINGMG